MLNKKLIKISLVIFIIFVSYSNFKKNKLADNSKYYNYSILLKYYKNKKYKKTLKILKLLIFNIKFKKKKSLITFYKGYCSFYKKKYVKSSFFFQKFCKYHCNFICFEDALYMRAYSLYLESLKIDFSKKNNVINFFKLYLKIYPNSIYSKKCKKYLNYLKKKKIQNIFNNIKLYYELGYYKSTMINLINFQKISKYNDLNEKALYLQINSQYNYIFFNKNIKKNKNFFFINMINYCNIFFKKYHNSLYIKNITYIYINIFTKKYLKI